MGREKGPKWRGRKKGVEPNKNSMLAWVWMSLTVWNERRLSNEKKRIITNGVA